MMRPAYLASRKPFEDMKTVLRAYSASLEDKKCVEERVDRKIQLLAYGTEILLVAISELPGHSMIEVCRAELQTWLPISCKTSTHR